MADSPTSNGKHGFFQSIQSVLPTHNPLHRHHRASGDIIRVGSTSTTLPANLDEPPSDKTRKKGDLLTAADQLTLFRSLVGIDNPPGLHASTFFRGGRPADNIGIYARVVQKEAQSARSFKMSSAFISFCISAQVLVAACLTALGAGNASHRAVTAFGALNTVLAGFMAYFKGSGLPNRLKYYKNEWTKLREYIEQRERDFCREEHGLDLEYEVRVIERMYEEVKGDIEANTPDSFVSVRDIHKRGGAVNPGPALARGAGSVVDAAADRVQERFVDPAQRSAAGLKRNLSQQSEHFGDAVAGYGDRAARYGDEKITGYGDRAARYGDERVSGLQRYGDEKLSTAQTYGNERLSGLQSYGNDKITGLQGYGSEKIAPYQEQAAGYNEKLSDLGQKAYDYAGRLSSFLEKPHSVGVSIDRPKSPPLPPVSPPPPTTTTTTTTAQEGQQQKEKKDPEHMV
jgi:hypothetical protein